MKNSLKDNFLSIYQDKGAGFCKAYPFRTRALPKLVIVQGDLIPRTDARQVQTIVKEVFSNRNAKRNTTNILLEIGIAHAIFCKSIKYPMYPQINTAKPIFYDHFPQPVALSSKQGTGALVRRQKALMQKE
jgi:hypothetical protein